MLNEAFISHVFYFILCVGGLTVENDNKYNRFKDTIQVGIWPAKKPALITHNTYAPTFYTELIFRPSSQCTHCIYVLVCFCLSLLHGIFLCKQRLIYAGWCRINQPIQTFDRIYENLHIAS